MLKLLVVVIPFVDRCCCDDGGIADAPTWFKYVFLGLILGIILVARKKLR